MQSVGPFASTQTVEPSVIDKELLVNVLIDQGPKEQAAKFFLEDGIKFDEVENIRIEFFNILSIDHLWIMPNLVHLNLSNNIIEKIENLDVLVHLKELNLSFNRITQMANLDHLINLEILLLYGNDITEVEGIENLNKLRIFSIGSNKIQDWSHIHYLRKLKSLRSLNMSPNPCEQKEGYDDYLVAFMPQLIYFRYKMITEEERQNAVKKHRLAISDFEEKEFKVQKEIDDRIAFEETQVFLSKSYVEYLDNDTFFHQLFANDKEGTELSNVTDDTQAAYQEYRKKLAVICHELYEFGINEQKRRDAEVKLFNESVNEGKRTIENKARAIVDEMLEKKTEIFVQISELLRGGTEELELEELAITAEIIQNFSEEFNDALSKMWTELMAKEVVLHNQIEEVNHIFKINMTDVVEIFLENAQTYFSRMRNAEAEYNDGINNAVIYYLSGFGDDAKVPSHLIDLCGDKDTLTTNLAGSHDMHLQIIDAREDRMINRLRTWLTEYSEQLANEEIERHRKQILEISHFVQELRRQFDLLVAMEDEEEIGIIRDALI